MKKNTFVKILVTMIAVAAVIAGAIAIYKKFFCKSDDLCDFADDFEDEDNIEKPAEMVKRGYVSIPLEESDNTVAANEAATPSDEESNVE